MKTPNSRGMTLSETLVVIVLATILIVLFGPLFFSRTVTANAKQTKQIINVKQITLACQLFAADHAGNFPNGHFDPVLGKITGSTPATTAEACFNDLLKANKLETEKVFWNPQNFVQCYPGRPDGNGILDPDENCWDYIFGLTETSPADIPLIFEASDAGAGITWTKDAGHPWEVHVIVGYADGSAEKMNQDHNDGLKVERGGINVDFCVPTPGSHGWPTNAKIAPATPKPQSETE